MVYTQALTKRLVPPVSWRLGNYVLAPSSANVERYMWLGCLAAKPTEFSRTKLPLHTLSAVTQIAASRAICFILLVEKEDLPSEVEIDQQKIDLVAFCTFLAQCNSSGQARLIKSIMLDQTGPMPNPSANPATTPPIAPATLPQRAPFSPPAKLPIVLKIPTPIPAFIIID